MVPGVALFYAHRTTEDLLLKVMLSLSTTTIWWWACGYSLSFRGDNGFIGDFSAAALSSAQNDESVRGPWSPSTESIYMAYQLAFAALTPILMLGAMTNRFTRTSLVLFTLAWDSLVYTFVAHWMWSENGWLNALGALDFAGGFVVHVTSGFSSLIIGAMVHSRERTSGKDEEARLSPNAHFLGGLLAWAGWIGFNAGSGLGTKSGSYAALATLVAPCGSVFSWFGLASVSGRHDLGFPELLFAAYAGLVTITPMAGYVKPEVFIPIGVIAALVIYPLARMWKASWLEARIEDHNNVFLSHGVAGVLGSLLLGLFASEELNAYGSNGAFYGGGGELLWKQAVGVLAVVGWSCAVTAVIILGVQAMGMIEKAARGNGKEAAQPGAHAARRALKIKLSTAKSRGTASVPRGSIMDRGGGLAAEKYAGSSIARV